MAERADHGGALHAQIDGLAVAGLPPEGGELGAEERLHERGEARPVGVGEHVGLEPRQALRDRFEDGAVAARRAKPRTSVTNAPMPPIPAFRSAHWLPIRFRRSSGARPVASDAARRAIAPSSSAKR